MSFRLGPLVRPVPTGRRPRLFRSRPSCQWGVLIQSTRRNLRSWVGSSRSMRIVGGIVIGFSAWKTPWRSQNLEPVRDRLTLDPGDDHLAVEVFRLFLGLRKGEVRAVGHDRAHGVAVNPEASALAPGVNPLAPSRDVNEGRRSW